MFSWSFSADGNGTTQGARHARPLIFGASGTWGSGTLVLQYSPDGGTTWLNVPSVSLTANGAINSVRVPRGPVRPSLSGATNPSLTVWLQEVV